MQLKFHTPLHFFNTRFFAIVLFLFSGSSLFAQTDARTALQENFATYTNACLQEKLFVHTDKNFYVTGEILWFKLYCVEGTTHTPLDVSKVAYVEILDKANKAIVQAKVELKKGEGNGSVYLPVTLNSGNYHFRAYTAWMKNFGAAYFFEKELTVINPLKGTTPLSADVKPMYRIEFFPEGGNLVNGLQSKLAFKAANEYGKGIDFKGVIINERNDTVTKFQPLKFGMGNLLFTPAKEHRYKAIITTGKGTITKELPQAYNTGYVMNVSTAGNRITVTVETNTTNSEAYLVLHNNRQVTSAEKISFSGGKAQINIDRNKLGEGVTQFTLFDNTKQPLCERLYFVRPAQSLAFRAISDAPQYPSRKRVSIAISSKDTEGKPLPSNMSLSVYQLDSLQRPDENSIVNYLWLTSDIKGTIETPGYYFESNDAAADEALDNLLLTQGWRRFQWKDIAAGAAPSFVYPPEIHGPIITGKVVDTRTGLTGADVTAFLSIPGSTPRFYSYKSNDSGIVHFNAKDYYGPGEIIVQTDAQVDSTYRVEVQNPFFEEYSIAPLPPFTVQKEQQQHLLDDAIGMQVQNVYVKDSMAKFRLPRFDTLPFYGRPDISYNLDDYTRFTSMEEVLREYVREINVRRREGKLQMVIINEPQREFFESNYLVLLDGVPVFDQSKLFNYDPLKIKRLDVITRRYLSGYSAFNGVASFTTYKGELEDYPLDPKAVVLDYEGLQLRREFYAPVYETEKQTGSRLPDFRNVLYWSPNVQTGKDGKTNIDFYTGDGKGKYLVVVQGINADGKAAYTSSTFEVK